MTDTGVRRLINLTPAAEASLETALRIAIAVYEATNSHARVDQMRRVLSDYFPVKINVDTRRQVTVTLPAQDVNVIRDALSSRADQLDGVDGTDYGSSLREVRDRYFPAPLEPEPTTVDLRLTREQARVVKSVLTNQLDVRRDAVYSVVVDLDAKLSEKKP